MSNSMVQNNASRRRYTVLFGQIFFYISFATCLVWVYAAYELKRYEAASFMEQMRLNDQVRTLQISYLVCLGVAVLFYLPFLIFGMMWMWRAIRNLRDNSAKTSYRPGWAIAGWLIPLAGYVLPPRIAGDIFERTGSVVQFLKKDSAEDKPGKSIQLCNAWFYLGIGLLVTVFVPTDSQYANAGKFFLLTLGFFLFTFALKKFGRWEDEMLKLWNEGAFQAYFDGQEEVLPPETPEERPEWYSEDPKDFESLEEDVFQDQNHPAGGGEEAGESLKNNSRGASDGPDGGQG